MGAINRYGAGQEPEKEGTVALADVKLSATWLSACMRQFSDIPYVGDEKDGPFHGSLEAVTHLT